MIQLWRTSRRKRNNTRSKGIGQIIQKRKVLTPLKMSYRQRLSHWTHFVVCCCIFLNPQRNTELQKSQLGVDCGSFPNLCSTLGLQLHCFLLLKLRISGWRLRHLDLPGREAQQGCHTASHLPTGVIIHSSAATRDTKQGTGQRPWQMAASVHCLTLLNS